MIYLKKYLLDRMLLARRKDLTPKQTIFSEICLSAAIFQPQTLIFLYICGGGNCSVFREHSVQISIRDNQMSFDPQKYAIII